MKHARSIRPADQRGPRSAEEARRRKQRVLTKQRSSITHSIAEAIVIKDGDLFFLSNPDGRVPLEGAHGCGLYYHDCRYLDGHELRLADAELDVLSASAAAGDTAVHELTNPDIDLENGRLLQKEELGVTIERTVDGDRLALHETVMIQNFTALAIELPLLVTFRAAFEDIFEVRGLLAEHLGRAEPPSWKHGVLRLVYHGADALRRELTIRCSPSPEKVEAGTGTFRVRVDPQATWRLHVSVEVAEVREGERGAAGIEHDGGAPAARAPATRRAAAEPKAGVTRVQSGSPILDAVVDRSLRDLHMLRSRLRGRLYYGAGIPWYVTLFGRDSLISSLETLAYDPRMAEETLRLLASYQSEDVDQSKDAEPGKIPHELRFGEMAHLGEIPHSPYYGTIDATPLFLILLGSHAEWTGDLRLFHELRGNAERALEWMSRYGDSDGDGYLDYHGKAEKGLLNQGWKDSGDAIVNADGSLADPPIALVEVQGYAYGAKAALAGLFRRSGDAERAASLEREAATLREHFNRDFWVHDAGLLALALQKGGRPAAVAASNPGQALWSGIVAAPKAAKVAERLMQGDMFNGWGVRTLSSSERAYNPIGYHLGTVWPHDNALIAAGLRRYGRDDAFHRMFGGMLDAASHFQAYRLPEVFAGFEREQFGVPVKYPVACHPQAWAAGAVPYMLATALGLVPDAFERRLRIVRPVLPPFVSRLDLSGLRVGAARVDLRFEQGGEGIADVRVLRTDGELEVVAVES